MFGGTYTHVDPQHLTYYFDELSYRYNRRKLDDMSRFIDALCHISGKRLTYKELTGKEGGAEAF